MTKFGRMWRGIGGGKVYITIAHGHNALAQPDTYQEEKMGNLFASKQFSIPSHVFVSVRGLLLSHQFCIAIGSWRHSSDEQYTASWRRYLRWFLNKFDHVSAAVFLECGFIDNHDFPRFAGEQDMEI